MLRAVGEWGADRAVGFSPRASLLFSFSGRQLMVSNRLVDMAGRIALQIKFGLIFERLSLAVKKHLEPGTQYIGWVDFNDFPDLPCVQENILIVGI